MYKISIIDSCGEETGLSPSVQSINVFNVSSSPGSSVVALMWNKYITPAIYLFPSGIMYTGVWIQAGW